MARDRVTMAMNFGILPLLIGGALLLAGRNPSPSVRTYYIAADTVAWNYAPSGTDQVAGRPFNGMERQFVEAGPGRIGSIALKSLYREYTDSTFTTLKPRPPEWEHLGFLGPLIRAEVGDTIRIIFRNQTNYPASMHPHGVFYNKDSEGAPYQDGTGGADKADDGVPPGSTHTYVWAVPERAGPGHGDPSSVFWMYHSHVHETADVNAGLVGPMIVSARGMTRPNGSPKDVDREIIVAFAEMDENESIHFPHNLRTYAGTPDSVVVDTVFGTPQVRRFAQYWYRESMNGFLYGNGPMITMHKGERVRWYVMATTNFEMHAPHWHGNVVEIGHMRTDVASLTPMEMVTADMVPDNPGVWLFHCHLGNHLLMGMQTRYTVLNDVATK
jgi:FtsP/CotA-like multicopper oxidase with cupredoxin domain